MATIRLISRASIAMLLISWSIGGSGWRVAEATPPTQVPYASDSHPAGSSVQILDELRKARPQVLDASGQDVTATVLLDARWDGNEWHGTITNRSQQPIRLSELIVADVEHGLPHDARVYGEGFTMLAQTGGTLAQPVDEGFYPDRSHYKIPEPAGLRTVYGLITLQTEASQHWVLGFTSCRKFIGRFSFSAERLRASFDLENLELSPGESWELEPLVALQGPERAGLLEQLARKIGERHPPIFRPPTPTGWCSWYCFGPEVNAKQVRDNLVWSKRHFPQLRYIQIDDGYQPWMGDWLLSGNSFGGDVRAVIKEIRELGFEPAIWVAPMIASPQSVLFKEHPDWFVQDENGRPLRSDRLGFGGWRLGPWYSIDGTHPEAQKFLEELFRTLREEWGCSYFKLDATYWGAIHGGVHYDRKASRIEAYRRAMEAVRRGAGDALLLGCNHPIWPSLGLIHASRSSMDITRDWEHISKTGRENLLRGWQNGRLWWNDPDCLVLNRNQSGPLSSADQSLFQFHATLIYSTGGMLLTGDDMSTYGDREQMALEKLHPPTGECMTFADARFTVGVLKRPSETLVALFRWDDTPDQLTVPIERRSEVVDFWTDESLGVHDQPFTIRLPASRSARLLKLLPR